MDYTCYCGARLRYAPEENKWSCPQAHQVYICRKCEARGKSVPLQWIQQYERWYCYECREYAPTSKPSFLRDPDEQEKAAQKMAELGVQAHENGDLDKAESLYKQALEIFERLHLEKEIAALLIWMGNLARNREQLGEAEVHYRRALEIYQRLGDKKSVSMLVEILHMVDNERTPETDQVDEAIMELKRAEELNPDSPEVHYDLGIAYSQKGWTDQAIEKFRQTIRLNPDIAVAHYNLGAALYRKGLINEAIVELQRAEELEPDDPDSHCDLVLAYARKGWLDQAEKEFKLVLKLDPKSAEAHKNLAFAYLYSERIDLAWKYLRKAEKLGLAPDEVNQLMAVLKLQGDEVK
jgi:Flp pilus assembly protein TadD